MFIYIDKETNEEKVFKSIPSIKRGVGISKNTLYNHFTRKGADKYETKKFKIVKTEIIK